MDLDSLISENEDLIYSILHRHGLAYDNEAISAAYNALWVACTKWDKKKAALSTFATVCITNAVYSLLRQRSNAEPVLSYDTPLTEDGLTLLDQLPCSSAEDNYVKEESYNETLVAVERLVGMIPKSKKKDIIQKWLSTGCSKNTKQLGEEFNVSQSYASFAIVTFRASVKEEIRRIKC